MAFSLYFQLVFAASNNVMIKSRWGRGHILPCVFLWLVHLWLSMHHLRMTVVRVYNTNYYFVQICLSRCRSSLCLFSSVIHQLRPVWTGTSNQASCLQKTDRDWSLSTTPFQSTVCFAKVQHVQCVVRMCVCLHSQGCLPGCSLGRRNGCSWASSQGEVTGSLTDRGKG